MRPLPNKAGHHHHGKTSFSDRSISDGYSAQIRLYHQANTVDLVEVFRHYKLNLSASNNKICCPFKFHKDKTPSFYYFKLTNSWHCFGCGNTGNALKFIMLMDDIDKLQAANKLIAGFDSNNAIEIDNGYVEKINLYFQFSTIIRNFIRAKLDDPQAMLLADKMCQVFDRTVKRHKGLEIEGLERIIDKIAEKLHGYQSI